MPTFRTFTRLLALLLLLSSAAYSQKIKTQRKGDRIYVEGTKTGFNSMDKTVLKAKCVAAAAALDAGYQYFVVESIDAKKRMRTTTTPGMGAVIGLPRLGARTTTTASKNNEIIGFTIRLVEGTELASLKSAGNPALKDALTEYNSIGAEALGNKYTPRNAPVAKSDVKNRSQYEW